MAGNRPAARRPTRRSHAARNRNFSTILRLRLEARRAEIEQALRARIYGLDDPADVGNPQYLVGVRTAVGAAVDYALSALEANEHQWPPVPAIFLGQARLAAQSAVPLDVVLRRYVAGFAVLSDFVLQEAIAHYPHAGAQAIRSLHQSYSSLLDRLLNAVSAEYRRGQKEVAARSSSHRRLERVKRLLSGEPLDCSDLNYRLDAYHLALVTRGFIAGDALREVASTLDRRLLVVQPDQQTAWVWLGGRDALDPDRLRSELEPIVSLPAPIGSSELAVSVGEPGEGLPSWRLTHRQAKAALAVALRRGQRLVRYADVALTASIINDELLIASLHELYLMPLESHRDGGQMWRTTLRAYFRANRNVASAAAALGVNRNTVANRIRAIEEALGRPLAACGTQLEVALTLVELTL